MAWPGTARLGMVRVAPSDVGVCLVTRGNVSMEAILSQYEGFGDVVVWDNSEREEDLAVRGRYQAMLECEREVILVQDDDVLLPPGSIAALLAMYDPISIVCNQPEAFRHSFYTEHSLVGFGGLFCAPVVALALARFMTWCIEQGELEGAEGEALFNRTCDIPVTVLVPRILVDVPKTNLPYAEDANRMYKQESHVAERSRMLNLALQVRDGR